MDASWERMMLVVNTSLFNIVKDRILTDFQMITVFAQVENMVNNQTMTVTVTI